MAANLNARGALNQDEHQPNLHQTREIRLCDGPMNKTQANGLLALTRPFVDKEKAVKLASSFYGLHVCDFSQVKEFVSYDDRNFYVKGVLPGHSNEGNGELQTSEDEFVLKILNHVDSENISFVNGQNEVLLRLKEQGFLCPVPVKALNGEYTIQCELNFFETAGDEGRGKERNTPPRVYAVRLLSFVPGMLLREVPCTSYLLFSLGCYIAKMNKSLQEFHHPGVTALLKKEWDLSQLFILEGYISVTSHSDTEQQVLQEVYNSFVNEVIPRLDNLKKHIIHGDVNDENILVIPDQYGDSHKVSGLLDFGDVAVSYRVFEVAICMMYVIVLRVRQGDAHDEAIRVVGHFLQGYQSFYGLSHAALALLYWSVAGRFFQSLVIGRYKQSLEPNNRYLSQSSRLRSKILSSYITVSGDKILKTWLSM